MEVLWEEPGMDMYSEEDYGVEKRFWRVSAYNEMSFGDGKKSSYIQRIWDSRASEKYAFTLALLGADTFLVQLYFYALMFVNDSGRKMQLSTPCQYSSGIPVAYYDLLVMRVWNECTRDAERSCLKSLKNDGLDWC